MIIKANELPKYMEMHNVDKIPVEVVTTEVPECKELRQGKRTLAKRLVITTAEVGKFGSYIGSDGKYKKMDAVRIHYAMYNSFKKSQCYLPPEWELEVLTGDLGSKMINELEEHGGNLEKKFREAFAKYNPEIREKVDTAAKLLREAEKLSEEHGIPFKSPKGGLLDSSCNGYFPQSFDSIYGDLLNENPDIVDDVTGVYRYDSEYGGSGWQSSHGTC